MERYAAKPTAENRQMRTHWLQAATLASIYFSVDARVKSGFPFCCRKPMTAKKGTPKTISRRYQAARVVFIDILI